MHCCTRWATKQVYYIDNRIFQLLYLCKITAVNCINTYIVLSFCKHVRRNLLFPMSLQCKKWNYLHSSAFFFGVDWTFNPSTFKWLDLSWIWIWVNFIYLFYSVGRRLAALMLYYYCVNLCWNVPHKLLWSHSQHWHSHVWMYSVPFQ